MYRSGSTAIVWGLTVRSGARLEYYIKRNRIAQAPPPPYIVHIRRFDLIIKSVIVSNVSECFKISAKSARMFSLFTQDFYRFRQFNVILALQYVMFDCFWGVTNATVSIRVSIDCVQVAVHAALSKPKSSLDYFSFPIRDGRQLHSSCDSWLYGFIVMSFLRGIPLHLP